MTLPDRDALRIIEGSSGHVIEDMTNWQYTIWQYTIN